MDSNTTSEPGSPFIQLREISDIPLMWVKETEWENRTALKTEEMLNS